MIASKSSLLLLKNYDGFEKVKDVDDENGDDECEVSLVHGMT